MKTAQRSNLKHLMFLNLKTMFFFALAEVLPEEEEDDGVLIMMVDGDIDSDDAELIMVEDEDLLKRAFDEFVRRDQEFADGE